MIIVMEKKDYLVFVGFGYCIIISLIEIELFCWLLIKEFLIRLIEDKLFIRVCKVKINIKFIIFIVVSFKYLIKYLKIININYM